MNLLDELKALRDGPKEPGIGICAHLLRSPQEFRNIAAVWPHFSGDKVYPVPCPNKGCPQKAYTIHQWHRTTWEGEYGASRLNLLDFAINYLEQK